MKSKLLFSVLFCISLVGGGFAQEPAAPISPPVNADSAKGYLLGPGDEISGRVLGEPQFEFIATVNEDGNILVPFSDKPVRAVCRTEKQLRADLVALLEKQLRNPQFNFFTKRNSRPPATIYGEVRTPSHYDLKRKATLIELLALSGGVTDEAGGVIEIVRTQPPLCADERDETEWKTTAADPMGVPMKMYSLASLRSGKDDPIIYPGDVVHVMKAPPVYVIGEVVAPQGIFLREGGMTLSEAIAKLGGVRREAKTKDIKIYRLKSQDGKERDVLTANLDRIRKGEEKDLMLYPNDIVQVDQAKDSLAQTILKFAIGAGRAAVTSGATNIGYRVVY